MTPANKKKALKMINDVLNDPYGFERTGSYPTSRRWFLSLRDLISPPKDTAKELQKDLKAAKKRIAELEKKVAAKALTKEEAKAKEIREANFREPLNEV